MVDAKQAETELSQMEDLVAEILKLEAKERKARDEKKKLIEKAKVLAVKNRKDWFGDKRSFRLESGMAKFDVVAKAVAGGKFDLDEFIGNFPQLFKFKAEHNIPAGQLRTLLEDPERSGKLKMLDVSLDSREVFKVEK